jgi:hypothetical protein
MTPATPVTLEIVRNEYDRFSSVLRRFSIFFVGDALPIVVEGKPSLGMMTLRSDPVAIKLRDSIQMRMGSVVFHCNLLANVHQACLSEYREGRHIFDKASGASTQELLMRYSQQEMYVYEDVIFHMISLFDFLGNLVCYVFRGPEGKQAKWKGAIEFAGVKMPKEKKSEYREDYLKVIEKMKKHHSEFIKKLQDIRASSYHYQISMPSASSSLNLMNLDASRIEINTPEYISKWMKRIFPNIKTESIALMDSALILANESLLRSSDIIQSLQVIVGIRNKRKYQGSESAPDPILRKAEGG